MVEIRCLAIGSKVCIKEAPPGESSERIEGRITKVIVDANHSVEYLIEYWDGRLIRREWFYPSSIDESPEATYMAFVPIANATP